jgi:hypothetical protein
MTFNVNWENQRLENWCSEKFRHCFSKNKGFKVMWQISRVSDGEDLVDSADLKGLGMAGIMRRRKYIFSIQSSVIWHWFTMHNLKMTAVVHCNQR